MNLKGEKTQWCHSKEPRHFNEENHTIELFDSIPMPLACWSKRSLMGQRTLLSIYSGEKNGVCQVKQTEGHFQEEPLVEHTGVGWGQRGQIWWYGDGDI